MTVPRKPPTPAPECYRHPPLEAFCRVWAQQGHVAAEREEGEASRPCSVGKDLHKSERGLALERSVGDVVAHLGLAAAELQ